ncbi:hypothetical protein M798_14750 [Brucella melitensis ADMAS-G1]|nr:hypothetical protein M798_14750 [Brucella melitensis ADMAS-G1]
MENRGGIFRGFRIGKDIGLVRPLVYRRAAKLGKPEGLGLRHPCGRRSHLHTIDAVIMPVAPPAMEILVAINPGLGRKPIGDWCAPAGQPVLGTGIIPVVALAGIDAAA